MYYSHSYQTRWHDTDADRHVRPSQMLVYMQETANYHMQSVGQSLDDVRDQNGLAFILTRLTVNFHRPLLAHENINVRTWIGEGKGLNFPRCFSVERENGEIAAQGASQWALIDLKTHLPVKASSFSFAYAPEEPLPITTPRRFVLPEKMVEVGQRRIVYSDVDYNGHMNNTRYPDMLCDFLPDGIVPHIRTMHFSYLKEGTYGATLRVLRGERTTESGKAYLFHTLNEQGELCLEAEVLTDLH